MSVIVPVRNRRDLLSRMLDGLEAQLYSDFELIVVDDGSTDGCTEEALARIPRGLMVRVIPSHGAGAVAARTLGVEESDGEILAFTDSDCVPRPDWLQAAIRAIDCGADVVKGATHPARWPLAPFERSVGSYDEGLYPTCNMFYRRETFQRFGGFNSTEGEELGFRLGRRARGLGFGEDTLLAWRAKRGGATVRYEEAAAVEHHVFPPDIVESIGRTAVVGAFPSLLRLVPELEPQLLRFRWFFGPRLRLPLYLAAVASLLGLRRTAFGALAWWIAERGRELETAPISRWRKVGLLPAEMAMDVATAGALLAGSIRARKIVL